MVSLVCQSEISIFFEKPTFKLIPTTALQSSRMVEHQGFCLLVIAVVNCGATEEYPSPLLFVKFGNDTHDLSGKNSDPDKGSAVTYTTGPYENANGAVLLDGTVNSWIEWTNGAGGPLEFKTEVTFIAW